MCVCFFTSAVCPQQQPNLAAKTAVILADLNINGKLLLLLLCFVLLLLCSVLAAGCCAAG